MSLGGDKMNKDLDALLDECIDRMNGGESLEECLASYPEHSGALRPLLTTVRAVHQDSSAIPGATARSVTRRHLDAALAHSDKSYNRSQRRTRPFWGWARVLATVTTAMAVAALGFGLYQLQAPATAPVNAQANFSLLISDEPNDIADFSSLEVTISSFGVLSTGEPGGWQEFELEPAVVVDLTLLPGLNAIEIWNGFLPEGQYRKVFIYIDDVTGTLKNGEAVTTKLPSGKFHISKPFAITTDGSTIDFVYDVTAVKAGQSGKYILKPQLSQSGAEQEFHQVGEGELVIEIVDGVVAPGETITILVTHEGDPVAGALVIVNDDIEVGPTGADGLISFIVPDDDELEIEAVKGDLEGELEIELDNDLESESHEGELVIEIVDGVVAPGETITILVTHEGNPLAGTLVTVNDYLEVGPTGPDGLISFIVPDDDELEIEAVRGQLKGELEIDLV
jgi:hypothetical protein